MIALVTARGEALICNSGGPRSRTRTELLRSSLLGHDENARRFPHCLSVGLDFGKHDPLLAVEKALRRARVADPEELRARFELPVEPCLCRENPALPVPRLAEADDELLLQQALLLGLCTPHFFDPRRPVLFTRTSLARRLELYLDHRQPRGEQQVHAHAPGRVRDEVLLSQRHQQFVWGERLVGHHQAAHPQDHRG